MIERQILSRLDADTAEALGELYAGLGRELLVQARYTAASQAGRERRRRRRAEARQIARLVDRETAAGKTARQAVAAAHALFPAWKPEHIGAVWMLFRQSASQRQARRDLEIVRLARRGLMNSEIAARFRLHKDTVSRIITRQLGGQRRRFDRATEKENSACLAAR